MRNINSLGVSKSMQKLVIKQLKSIWVRANRTIEYAKVAEDRFRKYVYPQYNLINTPPKKRETDMLELI